MPSSPSSTQTEHSPTTNNMIIDLNKIDEGQPHWLSKQRKQTQEQTQEQAQAKRAQELRDRIRIESRQRAVARSVQRRAAKAGASGQG
jgi:hypothetical protein